MTAPGSGRNMVVETIEGAGGGERLENGQRHAGTTSEIFHRDIGPTGGDTFGKIGTHAPHVFDTETHRRTFVR